MKKKTIASLVAIVAIIAVVLLVGFYEEKIPTPTPQINEERELVNNGCRCMVNTILS